MDQHSVVRSHEAGGEISRLKQLPGEDLAIFGSATLTRSLIEAGLVDELRIMVHPIVLGAGKSPFAGMNRIHMKLLRVTIFGSGNVLLCYEPTYDPSQ